MFYFVIFIQTAINTGISIGAILLAGECIQVYSVGSYWIDITDFMLLMENFLVITIGYFVHSLSEWFYRKYSSTFCNGIVKDMHIAHRI